ncbi:RNA polymerase sigma factor [Myxococcota bacterium]
MSSAPRRAGNDTGKTLRELLPELVGPLRWRALRLTRNPAVAEDLVQDTLERALRFESTYETNTNPRAWVRQIMLSVFISRCRRLRRERHALEVLAADPCAWTRDVGMQPSLDPVLPSVDSAIAQLPPDFASVIRLVDMAEHSYRDTAERLGVPLGTVMSRLFRARRLLATRLFREPIGIASAA